MRVELDALRQRVLIDKGSRDHVYKGQAVIDAYGVVGQVSNVGPVSAEVILLSDNSHSIPVQVSRNDLRTIATGSGDPLHLALNFLPRAADVKVDDLLLTSGLGGVFPAGYPVGRVAEVRRDPSQPLSHDHRRTATRIWIATRRYCSSGTTSRQSHQRRPRRPSPLPASIAVRCRQSSPLRPRQRRPHRVRRRPPPPANPRRPPGPIQSPSKTSGLSRTPRPSPMRPPSPLQPGPRRLRHRAARGDHP